VLLGGAYLYFCNRFLVFSCIFVTPNSGPRRGVTKSPPNHHHTQQSTKMKSELEVTHNQHTVQTPPPLQLAPIIYMSPSILPVPRRSERRSSCTTLDDNPVPPLPCTVSLSALLPRSMFNMFRSPSPCQAC
jgi:hypothetical protein